MECQWDLDPCVAQKENIAVPLGTGSNNTTCWDFVRILGASSISGSVANAHCSDSHYELIIAGDLCILVITGLCLYLLLWGWVACRAKAVSAQ